MLAGSLSLDSPEAMLLVVAFAIAYHSERQPIATAVDDGYLGCRVEQDDLISPICFMWVPGRLLHHLICPPGVILIRIDAGDVIPARLSIGLCTRLHLDLSFLLIRRVRPGRGLVSLFSQTRLLALPPLGLSSSALFARVYPLAVVTDAMDGSFEKEYFLEGDWLSLLLLLRW